MKEARIAPNTLGEGSVWDIALSRDPPQAFLYVADGMNSKVRVLDRKSLAEVTSFGDGGRYPSQFTGVHSIATDSKGNVFTTETYEGKRVQRFDYKGLGRDDEGSRAPCGPVTRTPVHRAKTSAAPRRTVQAPRFEVDPLWPKPLPNHWVIGMMVGVAVDSRDHVFIVHRPRSVNLATEAGGAANPATAECCTPAPPVLEFDPAGNLVNSWGGAGDQDTTGPTEPAPPASTGSRSTARAMSGWAAPARSIARSSSSRATASSSRSSASPMAGKNRSARRTSPAWR